MAKPTATIIIKRIEEAGHGHHGGAWKVAFADFMTAMMAFFLVMWLLASSNKQTKENIAEYFNTPSVIEYQFQNMGVVATLEKIFADLANDPLQALTEWLKPLDQTANSIEAKTFNSAVQDITNEYGKQVESLSFDRMGLDFELPAELLFENKTSRMKPKLIEVARFLADMRFQNPDSLMSISSIYYLDQENVLSLVDAESISRSRGKVLAAAMDKVSGARLKTPVDHAGIALMRGERMVKDTSGLISTGVIKISLKKDIKGKKPQSSGESSHNGSQNGAQKRKIDSLENPLETQDKIGEFPPNGSAQDSADDTLVNELIKQKDVE